MTIFVPGMDVVTVAQLVRVVGIPPRTPIVWPGIQEVSRPSVGFQSAFTVAPSRMKRRKVSSLMPLTVMLRLQAGKLGSRKLFLVAGRASLGLLAVFLDPGAAVTEDALPFLAGSGLVSDYGSRCRHALDYEHGDTVASDLLRGQSSFILPHIGPPRLGSHASFTGYACEVQGHDFRLRYAAGRDVILLGAEV